MKAFLIDPWTKEITEVQIPRDSEKQLLAIYFQLSHEASNWITEIFEAVPAGGNHFLLVDEEVHIKNTRPPCFHYDGQPIYGKALVVGESDGDFSEPDLTIRQVTLNVSFL